MRALRDSERRLTAELGASYQLHELSTQLIRGGDIHALCEAMLDTAVKIMHADFASVQVVDARSGVLQLLGYRGLHPASALFWDRVSMDGSSTACGEAARLGARVVIANTERCGLPPGSRDLEEMRRSGIRSVQSTPLLSQSGRLLGMLSTHWSEPYEPPPCELRTFDMLARQCAVLLERRQLEQALEDAVRRKDQFLATLAHELRNPLAPLRNGLAVMKAASNQPQVVATMRTMMERQVEQLVRMVDDLMNISRVLLGKIELYRERVDVVAIIRQLVEGFPSLLEQRRVELSLPAQPLYVDVDVTRITQVFNNLLNNAFKFTAPQARIQLDVRLLGREVQITFLDEGVGIPPEKLDDVFEIYAQLDAQPGRPKSGLGIGLSLVRQMVVLHGGTVSAQSDGPGRGAKFVVTLPVSAISLAAPPALRASAPVSRRVLVVDDDPDAVQSLCLLLQLDGSQTEFAYDGSQALQKGREFLPELVLLDIGMPGMNGYDTCRAIRAQSWGSSVRIVALSGWAQEADRTHAAAAGFDAHLIKPVAPEVLSKLLAEPV